MSPHCEKASGPLRTSSGLEERERPLDSPLHLILSPLIANDATVDIQLTETRNENATTHAGCLPAGLQSVRCRSSRATEAGTGLHPGRAVEHGRPGGRGPR